MKKYSLKTFAAMVLSSLFLSHSALALTAEELLTRDLTPAIKSIPRDMKFYHYFGMNMTEGGKKVPIDGSNIGKTNLKEYQNRQNSVQNKIYSNAANFWNLNYNNTELANAGPGLYIATDPFASSPEAGPEYKIPGVLTTFGPFMLEMNLRSGTKYIDLLSSVRIKQDTIAAIKNAGLLDSSGINKLLSGSSFSRDTVRYMVAANYMNFRRAIQNIFKSEGISFIEYGWQSGISRFCGNSDSKKIRSAFVYVGTEMTAEQIAAQKYPTDFNILSSIMVYLPGFSSTVKLDVSEQSAFTFNKKLHQVLYEIRKKERAATDPKLSNTLKVQVEGIIKANYADSVELQRAQDQLFKCRK